MMRLARDELPKKSAELGSKGALSLVCDEEGRGIGVLVVHLHMLQVPGGPQALVVMPDLHRTRQMKSQTLLGANNQRQGIG
eukprot:scaffold324716_cov21-Prasinocladus_malaysianus.AAC.1